MKTQAAAPKAKVHTAMDAIMSAAAAVMLLAATGCIIGAAEQAEPTADLPATVKAAIAIAEADGTPTPEATAANPAATANPIADTLAQLLFQNATATAQEATPTAARTTPAANEVMILPPPSENPSTPTDTTVPAREQLPPTDTVDRIPATRHIEAKRYMLELINTERSSAGLNPVSLGNNTAAQLHAEAALKYCFTSHWGKDGLKPYMRYTLAGGYHSNAENASGTIASGRCISAEYRYPSNRNINREVKETMQGWMESLGHRRNILHPHHRKVSIGIAYDRNSITMYQHFEGDYVEYERKPSITNGILDLSGKTRNGTGFTENRDLKASIYYDPPPRELSLAQLIRTHCYSNGTQIAGLRPPPRTGWHYNSDTFTSKASACPNPYDVPDDTPDPKTEAEAYRKTQEVHRETLTVPWITASQWTATGTDFDLQADIGNLLVQHGPGVYTVTLWGKIGNETARISEYSIFHQVTPLDNYRHP